MQARIVPTWHGVRWLAEGWRNFRASPLGWLSIVFVYVFGTNLAAFVPHPIVVMALVVAVPGLSVGMMSAARAASRGGTPRVAMLFEAFRDNGREQLILGGAYLACFLLIL